MTRYEFYLKYCRINGKPPEFRQQDKELFEFLENLPADAKLFYRKPLPLRGFAPTQVILDQLPDFLKPKQ